MKVHIRSKTASRTLCGLDSINRIAQLTFGPSVNCRKCMVAFQPKAPDPEPEEEPTPAHVHPDLLDPDFEPDWEDG